jgi:Cys-rich protein (TIGR01571 family)
MAANLAQPLAVPNEAPQNLAGEDANGIQLGQWKAGICDCADDCNNCLMSWLCPCFQIAAVVSRVGMYPYEHALIWVLGCIILRFCGPLAIFGAIGMVLIVMIARQRFRILFSIPGSDLDDCCCATFCGCCVIAQLAAHVADPNHNHCTFSAPPLLPGYVVSTQPGQAHAYQQPSQIPQAYAVAAQPAAGIPVAEPGKADATAQI